MNCLLDTNLLIWVTSDSTRLRGYPWLRRYEPSGVSPISLLEVAFLAQRGRLRLDTPFGDRVLSDDRFVVDDISSLRIVRAAEGLSWTRDPFDRLLAGHSTARRVPLCTTDETIIEHHRYLPDEVR